jgi:hypothetical protein
LNRGDQPIQNFIEILDGQEFAARDVAQLSVGREKYRRWKFRDHMVRKIEVHIEAPQVALFLTLNFIDLAIGKNLTASRLFHVRQGQETGRQQSAAADFLRAHRCKLIPGHPFGKLDAHTALYRPATAGHHGALDGTIREIVALPKQIRLSLHHLRLLRLVSRPYD